MAAVVAAVLFSLMVSYTRARAEALGVECKVGLATRPVRVVILSAGLVFARGLARALPAARARGLRARGAGHPHHDPADLARRPTAHRRGRVAHRRGRCNKPARCGIPKEGHPDRTKQSTNGPPTAPRAISATRSASRSSASATARAPSCRASSTTATPTRRAGPGPDARRPRRLPHTRHRVLGRVRHRLRKVGKDS